MYCQSSKPNGEVNSTKSLKVNSNLDKHIIRDNLKKEKEEDQKTVLSSISMWLERWFLLSIKHRSILFICMLLTQIICMGIFGPSCSCAGTDTSDVLSTVSDSQYEGDVDSSQDSDTSSTVDELEDRFENEPDKLEEYSRRRVEALHQKCEQDLMENSRMPDVDPATKAERAEIIIGLADDRILAHMDRVELAKIGLESQADSGSDSNND